MNVQTNMNMREILNNYETGDWVKSNKVEGVQNKLKLNDAPDVENFGTVHKSFGDFLADSVQRVNSLQKDANFAMEKLATGKSQNIHETMMAIERAEIAFKTMNQIRSKVIDAYREIMRMQI